MLYRRGPASCAQSMIRPEPNPTPTHNAKPILYPYMKVTTTYIMQKVYNRYNGCCCDLGPVSSKQVFYAAEKRWSPNNRLMCSPCHIRCVEIFVEPRNCCRTWNILVVVFLNCSCEINFRAPWAPSRYRKDCVIRKKIFHSDSFFFFDTANIKKSK